MSSRLRSRAALALVGVLALSLAAWVVVNSAFFGVERVEVRGNVDVADGDILRLAAVEPDTNLLRLSLDQVEHRLERDARIADAVAGRDLPSTLVLEVRERRPAAWLRDAAGPLVVAGDGTVLLRTQAPPRELPGLGDWPVEVDTGHRLSDPPPALVALGSMEPGLLSAIESAAESDGGIVLVLRAGGEVLYGDPASFAEKNRALTGLLGWADERAVDIQTIDVRVPEAPTLLPVGGTEVVPTPPPNP